MATLNNLYLSSAQQALAEQYRQRSSGYTLGAATGNNLFNVGYVYNGNVLKTWVWDNAIDSPDEPIVAKIRYSRNLLNELRSEVNGWCGGALN